VSIKAEIRTSCAALLGVALASGLATLGVSGRAAKTLDHRNYGDGEATTEIDGEAFRVFTYRPRGCASASLLITFHGDGRGAESYRDSASAFADRACFVVYAPLFDAERFPNWSYHRGGIVEDGKVRSPEEWTVELVPDFVEWARRSEGGGVPTFLFGHSAGGQFLSRVMAFAPPPGVERVVIANPSTYVLPITSEAAPYGFGSLPDSIDERALMKAYLAAPITVFLGKDDTGDDNLTMTEEATRQGDNRLERGRNVFKLAQRTARENGWSFGWTLVEADDVGHSAEGMLRAEEFLEALGFVPG